MDRKTSPSPKPITTFFAADVSARTVDDLVRSIAPAWSAGYGAAEAHRDMNEMFLGTPQGQRLLYFILDFAGLHRNPVDPEGREHVTYMNIGRQDMARFLIAVMTAPPAPEHAQAETEAPATPPKGN